MECSCLPGRGEQEGQTGNGYVAGIQHPSGPLKPFPKATGCKKGTLWPQLFSSLPCLCLQGHLHPACLINQAEIWKDRVREAFLSAGPADHSLELSTALSTQITPSFPSRHPAKATLQQHPPHPLQFPL